jgi:hypothetical protein
VRMTRFIFSDAAVRQNHQTIDHRPSTIEHRASTIDHRP